MLTQTFPEKPERPRVYLRVCLRNSLVFLLAGLLWYTNILNMVSYIYWCAAVPGNETLAPGLQYPPGLQYAGVPGPVSVARQVLAGVLPGQQEAGGVSCGEGRLQHWGRVHIVLTSHSTDTTPPLTNHHSSSSNEHEEPSTTHYPLPTTHYPKWKEKN